MKTFECKLAYKTNPLLTKIDFIKAEDAFKASATANKHNPDWICISADLVDQKYLAVFHNSIAANQSIVSNSHYIGTNENISKINRKVIIL